MLKILWNVLKLYCVALTTVFLIACEYDVHSKASDFKYIDEEDPYTPGDETIKTNIAGDFRLIDSLVPIKLSVVFVDENLRALDTVTAVISKNSKGYHFSVDSMDVPSRYARFDFVCVHGNDGNFKMKFSVYNYVNVAYLDLFGAISAHRVEELIRNENFYMGIANKKALREIYHFLDYEGSINSDIEEKMLVALPYLVLGYGEKSDSAFYENFKDLRSKIGTEVKLDDYATKTAIADAALQSTLSGAALSIILEDAYGFSKCDANSRNDSVSNKVKDSRYFEQKYVCRMDSGDSSFAWTPFSEVEVENGLCWAGRKDTVIFKDGLYYCDGNLLWKAVGVAQSMNILYRSCDEKTMGLIRPYVGELFICEKNSYNNYYKWNDELPDSSTIQNNLREYNVWKQYGECDSVISKKKVYVDSFYYQCQGVRWTPISAIDYIDEFCTSKNEGETVEVPLHKYYQCHYDNWKEVAAPVFYGDTCDSYNRDVVVKRDDKYYMCGAEWLEIPEEEVLPVILNEDVCDSLTEGSIKKYDDTYYICEAVLKAGCFYVGKWRTMTGIESLIYEKNLYKPCPSSTLGTSLEYDSTYNELLSCACPSEGSACKWQIAYHYKVLDDMTMTSGKYVEDSTYIVDYKGVTYVFYRKGKTLHCKKVIAEGKEYSAWAYNKEYSGSLPVPVHDLFVFPESKEDSFVSYDAIVNKSDSYDSFVADWNVSFEYSIRSLKMYGYNTDNFSDYQSAQNFCPKGFHIPDTTEWRRYEVWRLTPIQFSGNLYRTYDVSSESKDYKEYRLMWTSTEKNNDIEYCVELSKGSYVFDTSAKDVRMIECPKDLYPLVVPVCVKDR